MAIKPFIILTDEQRATLLDLVRKGEAPARRIRRAQILLHVADGHPDSVIARAIHSCRATVQRVRKRFKAEGLEAALSELPRPGAERKLRGKGEALLVALACTTPPDGRATWTMQLLADRLVTMDVVEEISDETVRRTLKKRNQTLAEGAVVHPPPGRGLRLAHGGRLGPVRRALRSVAARSVV